MEKQKETIKQVIKEILERMTISGEVNVVEDVDENRFLVKTDESRMLIGENGKNLNAFSHIVKKIIDVKFKKEEQLPFSIDVNNYQEKKIEELKNLARMNAQRVIYFKKEIIMPPMNSYERRIIHSSLSELPDITTESIGDGLDRRVVIKLYG